MLDGFELHLSVELLFDHATEPTERRTCFESCTVSFIGLRRQVTVVSTGPLLLYYVVNLRHEMLLASEVLGAVRLLLVALHVLGAIR